jgi:hypothetical protein
LEKELKIGWQIPNRCYYNNIGNGEWSPKTESKMEKLFTVAGTSSLEGVVKFRVANGSAAARTKVLERSGHIEIKLVDLAKPMSKEDAIAFVQSNGFVASVAEKPAKVAKAKPAKSAKVNLEKAVRTINASFKAKTTKEVPAEQLLAEVGIQPTSNSINEIAKI